VLGAEVSPLIVVIYADETKLTGFGNNTIWSVYYWLGNLPHKVRASFGKGGARLLAYLPKVRRLNPTIYHILTLAQGTSQEGLHDDYLPLYRTSLYQECFKLILEPMKSASRFGDVFRTGDGGMRNLVPIPALKPGDYPEMYDVFAHQRDYLLTHSIRCRMSGVAGKDCVAGCPLGSTLTKDFDKIGHICPPRDHDVELQAIEKALGPDADADDGIPVPHELGLRPVEVSTYLLSTS
jgi:Plavaka transposase